MLPYVEVANARIEDAVRPQHVDEAEQERGDDHERTEHDAQRQAWCDHGSEQRLVEREQPHEAEIHCDHDAAQEHPECESPLCQSNAAWRWIGLVTSLGVHIAP